MTNFTVLVISHLQNSGTKHLHGSCSCHRHLLLQLSLSFSSFLPTVSCHAWVSFFHSMLKLLSVVGAWWSVTFIAGLIYFASYSHFYLVKTSSLLLLSYSARAVAKQCLITFILKHTDNINERMLSHLHN